METRARIKRFLGIVVMVVIGKVAGADGVYRCGNVTELIPINSAMDGEFNSTVYSDELRSMAEEMGHMRAFKGIKHMKKEARQAYCDASQRAWANFKNSEVEGEDQGCACKNDYELEAWDCSRTEEDKMHANRFSEWEDFLKRLEESPYPEAQELRVQLVQLYLDAESAANRVIDDLLGTEDYKESLEEYCYEHLLGRLMCGHNTEAFIKHRRFTNTTACDCHSRKDTFCYID